ncbi:MAG: signal recognition particle-docking protein FtsY [Xenococcus sp. MO_188.B8]|nr:signal recognition particle-docking protein FtsY [Xenococcus sp. MO_188.B8]
MFNWFSRRHNKEESTENLPEAKTAPETPETSPAKSEDTSQGQTQEDYLAWAKAAYQNIQQRKEEETVQEEETATETVSKAEEPTEPETTTVKEEVVATAIVEETESLVLGETTTVAEEITEATADLETTTETTEIETTEIVEETAEAQADTEDITEATEVIEETAKAPVETEVPKDVPVWMQKSEGLEKLKETAIATPVVEPAVSEPELDEDFVWSAKVLAQEGRSPEDISQEEITWLTKLRQGLGKTRRSLVVQLKSVVGQGPLNKDAVMEIEALLLQADVGIEATDFIIETLQEKLREEALPPEQAIAYLKSILQNILDKPLKGQDNQDFVPEQDTLNIWLLTGVNGAGKTTTIGKLANLGKKSGYSCLIAAADTFRAAAVEQVKVWGERTDTPVIANPGKNTDPAAVVFDAIAAANSRNTELLLVDTAGRLQNKKNLMAELAKIRRIIDKKAPNATIESLLVLDATLGQNGLRQAQVFSEAAQLSGVVLTKLDGTAKGGVALAVAQQLDLPIRFIGAGEGIEDLRPFSSYEFVEALING